MKTINRIILYLVAVLIIITSTSFQIKQESKKDTTIVKTIQNVPTGSEPKTFQLDNKSTSGNQTSITFPTWIQTLIVLATIISIVFNVILTFLMFGLKHQQDLQLNQVQSYLKILERMELTRFDRNLIRTFKAKVKERNNDYKDTKEFWRNENLLNDTVTIEYEDKFRNKCTEPIQTVLDRVTREFDILGFMDRSKLIKRKMVNEFYAAPLVEFTPIFTGYMDKLIIDTEKRNVTHLWELKQFMHRVQNVSHNHPGRHNMKKWYRHPRRNFTKSKFSKEYWNFQ